MSNKCLYNNFINKTISEICQISENCSYDYINLYNIHYCQLNGIYYLSLPFFFFLGAICFYILSDTANKYLSQALTNISDKLNLSQNLAGVTFLAFGNGTPDVVTSIVASGGSGGEGLDVSIGALLGAGMFVSCLVFSMVVLLAKEVNVKNKIKIKLKKNLVDQKYVFKGSNFIHLSNGLYDLHNFLRKS